jgi:hypothetical protein
VRFDAAGGAVGGKAGFEQCEQVGVHGAMKARTSGIRARKAMDDCAMDDCNGESRRENALR